MGDFFNNKKHGNGRLENNDKGLSYEGQWYSQLFLGLKIKFMERESMRKKMGFPTKVVGNSSVF
jgi:hypothetical protein